MPGLFDADGQPFAVGDVVNVPMKVTAVGAATEGINLVTLVSKYQTPADADITVSTLYATQVVKDR